LFNKFELKTVKEYMYWLMCVISPTQEAEIQKIVVQGQLWPNIKHDPISTATTKMLAKAAHTCHSSCVGNVKRTTTVQASPDKNVRPYFKNNQSKKDRGITEGVEHSLSEHKDMSSNYSNAEKQNCESCQNQNGDTFVKP
jgi:hypothetical protein